ncbi:MAG TPA: NADH-quinone oxidoreductase subunit C [Propionibacteriaceae bacterium]|nr:NADH-quinone oxidoreductase subunit C [Propionibacteriaceae bacterium]
MSDQVSGENLPATPEAAETQPVAVRKGMWSEGTGDTSGYGGLVRPLPTVTGSTPPFGSYFDAIYERLIELVPDGVSKVVVDRGEFTVYVPREKLVEVMQAVRDDAHLRFEFCASASGVHYPHDTDAELHVVYELQSMTHNRRLRLEVTCPDTDPHVPSSVAVYPAMDWHEREAWDMFGIIFDGHPHLTRILMPDDWVGHPQRKDYPLGGIPIEFKGAVVQPVDERRSYR